MPRWVFEAYDLWAACRQGGGLGGVSRANVGPGGAGDQPAALMDVFNLIDWLTLEPAS